MNSGQFELALVWGSPPSKKKRVKSDESSCENSNWKNITDSEIKRDVEDIKILNIEKERNFLIAQQNLEEELDMGALEEVGLLKDEIDDFLLDCDRDLQNFRIQKEKISNGKAGLSEILKSDFLGLEDEIQKVQKTMANINSGLR
jgi:hypothetical protein